MLMTSPKTGVLQSDYILGPGIVIDTVHDNQLFIDAIDKLDESKKIFLCGDNKDVLKQIEDEFGDRIITHTQDRFNHPHLAESGHNHSIQTNVDAMIDLMLLSRCDTIVGTYASTFAEVAWWLGQCKSRVIIPEPVNVEESLRIEFLKL